MKITFNAPFTLIFALLAILAGCLNALTDGLLHFHFFSVRAPIGLDDPFSILRVFTHPIGHVNLAHLTGNFAIILLIGPMVEEYYGTWKLCMMSLVTAAITGMLHAWLYSSSLMGASGIAFMMILLASLCNSRRGSIPMSFIVIAFLYIGNEVLMVFEDNNISQLAHIVGGICGALFGFSLQSKSKVNR